MGYKTRFFFTLLFIVTIVVLSTLLIMMSSTNPPSILRSTVTSLASISRKEISSCFPSPLLTSLLLSLPRLTRLVVFEILYSNSRWLPPYHLEQGRSHSKAWGGHGPPKILKNYFILCISIKKFKYLATKIEVSPPQMFELVQ